MLGQFDVGRVELGYGYVSRRLGDVQVIGAVPDVEVVSLRDDDAVELVMAAGRDPAAYLDTSLPRKPSRWAARHWMRTFPQTAWLAYVDGSPAALERRARSRRRLSGLAGVTWDTNVSAHRRLLRSGYTRRWRVWYRSKASEDASGWCQVWTKPIPSDAP
ncbi:MAG: hypothetical protein ABW328_05580 [Ilumatobacteraceae bacterium]